MGEEDESPRQRLNLAKQKIKVWEGEYKAIHGCPPDREAMTQAPEDIRNAYKTYRYYRKAVTQEKTDKSSGRDKELLSASHDAKGDELLRRSSSGDAGTCVSVSGVEVVTSKEGNTQEEGSPRLREVTGSIGVTCDGNTQVNDGVNASDSGIKTGVNEVKTGNSDSGKQTPAAKFANMSSATWGRHLNKGSGGPKKVNKDLTLYTKMAEKLRANSTIKTRKSLSRVSSASKPQEKQVRGVSSTQTSRSSLKYEGHETSDSRDSCGNDSSKDKVTEEELLKDDSSEAFDDTPFGPVDELRPLSESEAMEAATNKDLSDLSDISNHPQPHTHTHRPTSIFEALEAKSLEGVRGMHFTATPKSLPSHTPDTVESDTFERTPKYHEGAQKPPLVQPISVLSTLGKTHTSRPFGIKKRANLNLAWVERCTGTPLEGNIAAGQTEESWKMKLIDKEWSEDVERERAEERERMEERKRMEERERIEDEYSDEGFEFSTAKNQEKATKLTSSPAVKSVKARTKTAATNANLKRSTVASSVTSNVAKPTKANKRKAPTARKTNSKAAQGEDNPTSTPHTGRVLRTRGRRNTPKPDYAEDTDKEEEEEDNISAMNGGRKRRIEDEEDEEWKEDTEELDDEEGSAPFVDEKESLDPAISDVCMRKRRKIETIEELEEQGKIQSQWPPPKKKRVARKKPGARGRPRKTDKENLPKKKPARKRKIQATVEEEEEEEELEVEERGLPAENPPQSHAPSTAYDETDDIESHGAKNTTMKGRYLTGEERLMKKVSTGSLNNNFVRINLKKKVYVRGKKTLNGGKYKRQEWKKKQLMKSAESGDRTATKNLTCFKCGDFGHWARNCPGKRGDKLTPLEEYDEKESTFLSLEEAAAMTLGIKTQRSESAVTRLYPKAVEAETGGDESNTEAGVDNSTSPQLENGDKEEIEGVTSESQAISVVADKEYLPDSQSSITNDPELDNDSQQAAGSAEYDFMNSDDDIFENLEEADFQEQEQGLSSSQDSITSTQHSSSQPYSNPWEERPTVEPLYALSDGEVIPTPEEVHDTLRMFGYPSYRAGQENAIMRILSGQSTLLVLSTGSGKSLCYQLPAYLYAKHRSPCITLCVSPLVSLMEDQVLGLPGFLKAVCLHTHQSPSQRSQALNALQSKAAHILLVSPEAVVASRSGGVLGTLLRELPPVAFACLDEAHCVSEWSHNFRPSYLRVCQVLRERLGVKTILGLTATARHATAQSIARHLLISDFDSGVIRGTSVPDNLLLSVSRDKNREEALVTLLQGERFSGCSSIIIYCTRRDECERVSTLIRTQLLDPSKIDVKSNLKRHRGLSFDAEAYHAGLSSHRRHQVQKRFMSGRLRIVVATVAFGMGIDKSDVRGIIHFNMPRNVESYVQEIGRAGRDGKEAHCHLFLDDQDGRDIQELKRHIFANSIDRHTIRKLLSKIFKPCTCAKLKSLSSGGEEKGDDNDAPVDMPSSPVRASVTAEDAGSAADPFSVPTSASCCPRHEVAIPIEAVVEELDLPEENLETLLCYLELHQGNLISIKSHVYANCTVSCYAGPRQLVAVSRKCPPLAVAIALERQKGKDFTKSNSVSFPVVEVSSRMGWNSKIVKRELKALEWNTQGLQAGGSVKRSGVVVEMTDLSFHLEARGDLSDDERDRVLDAVYRRSKTQELDQLRQLHYTYQLLRSVSHSTILFCCDAVDRERCERLRTELREYFRSDGALAQVEVEDKGSVKPEVECGIRSSVRAFLSTYSDQQWTGRAVARVLHGIGSPNYPTEVWGRVRRFWRQHLNTDFNVLVNIATQEILRCK